MVSLNKSLLIARQILMRNNFPMHSHSLPAGLLSEKCVKLVNVQQMSSVRLQVVWTSLDPSRLMQVSCCSSPLFQCLCFIICLFSSLVLSSLPPGPSPPRKQKVLALKGVDLQFCLDSSPHPNSWGGSEDCSLAWLQPHRRSPPYSMCAEGGLG